MDYPAVWAVTDSLLWSLPPELLERLDRLVTEGVLGSRSEALRYGARLVVREEQFEASTNRQTSKRGTASKSVWIENVSLDLDVVLAELKIDDCL